MDKKQEAALKEAARMERERIERKKLDAAARQELSRAIRRRKQEELVSTYGVEARNLFPGYFWPDELLPF